MRVVSAILVTLLVLVLQAVGIVKQQHHQLRMSHAVGEKRLVALPAAAIDSSLVMGVSLHDPHRLTSLIQFLFENNIPFAPPEILDDECVEVQLVQRSYARVSADTADELDANDRAMCVAIKGSEDLARPRSGMIHREIRVAFKNVCLSLRRVEDLTVEATLGSDKAIFTPENRDTLVELFADGPTNVWSEYDPQRRVCPRNALVGVLSYKLTECIAEWLQDFYRIHVLCTAASPNAEPRPGVLQQADLFQLRQDTNEKNWVTFVNATFHSSSASCVCPAHNRPRRAGKVRLCIRFCGRVLEDGVCPTHPLCETNGGQVCTAHLGANIICKHTVPPDGIKICLPTKKSIAHSVLAKIAEAAVTTVVDPAVEHVVTSAVTECIEEAREEIADAQRTSPTAKQNQDRQALHLLRSHSAIRKPNGRLGRMVGQTEGWLKDLSDGYSHLFPAHASQTL